MPTHGSLTKAGKVRQQTPKVARLHDKHSKSPRLSNRRRYHKRVELSERFAQDRLGQKWAVVSNRREGR